MTRALAALWALTIPLAIGGPLASWRVLASAQRGAERQESRLESLQSQVEELDRLRAAEPAWSRRVEGESPLAERLARTLSEAGIPASALESFAPQSQPVRAPSGVSLVRRSASLTLSPVTLPKLGSFLARWRQEAPAWLVSSIEMAPDLAAFKDASPGSDGPLRVTLVIESLVAGDAGATQ